MRARMETGKLDQGTLLRPTDTPSPQGEAKKLAFVFTLSWDQVRMRVRKIAESMNRYVERALEDEDLLSTSPPL